MTAPRTLLISPPRTVLFGLVAVAALLVSTWTAGLARADAYEAPTPWVASDKPDYAPGEAVTLNGGGWSPGETVQIRVNDDAGRTWSRDATVTATADGSISDQFALPDWFVATYTVTATGSTGTSASASFTDGNVVVRARSAPNSPLGVTFPAASVRRFNNTTCTAPSTASNTNAFTTNANNNNYTNSTVSANNSQSASITAPATITSAGTTYTFSGWAADSPAELAVSTAGTTGCFHRTTPNQGNDPAWNVTANYVAVPTNSAPAIAANNAAVTVSEGQTATNAGTWTDANAGDTVTLSASVGTVTKSGTNASGTWSWSLATTDGTDQSQTITITANDGTTTRQTTFALTVDNVPPTVTLAAGNDISVDEGATEHTYSYTISDPGADTVSSVSTGCGAEGTKVPGADTNTNTSGSFKCTFDDGSGTSTVGASATDSDNATGATATQTVSIANVNPTATFPATSTVTEGSAQTFAFTSPSDASGDDTAAGFHYAYSCTGASLAGASYAGADTATSLSCPASAFDDGPGSQTIRARIIDRDGGFTEYTAAVTIQGAPPTGSLANSGPIDEGGSATVTFFDQSDASSTDTASGFHYAYACDDGSLAGATYAGGDTSASKQCTFTDDGTHTVRARIIDKDGDSSEYTTNVVVTNARPVVTPANDQSSNEGATTPFDLGSFSDPGANDGPWSVDIDWGDGSGPAGLDVNARGSLGSQTHAYADDGAYTVTVTVTDKDGGSDSATFEVAVANVAPQVNLTGPNQADEGDTKVFDFTITDPGTDDTFHFVTGFPTCGLHGELVGASTGAPISPGAVDVTDRTFSCRFPDGDNSTNVSVKVADDDDAASTADTEHVDVIPVVVANVEPTVTAAADQTASEGTSKSFSLGAFSDPGTDSPWDIVVDWGDGSTHTTFQATTIDAANALWLGSASHTYDDSGSYTVTVTVTDKDGGSGSATFTANVSNVDPNADFANSGPIDEGGSATVSFTNPSDPSGADTTAGFRYAFSCDNSSLAGATYGNSGLAASTQCTFNDDSGAPFTVRARIIDKDGGYREKTTSIAVQNVGPHITSFTGTNYFHGPNTFLGSTTSASTFSGAWTDPGSDTWTALITWADGNPLTQTLSGLTTRSFPSPSVGHTFASAGCKSSSLKVTDDDGASDIATTVVNVGTAVFQPPMTNQRVTDKLKNGQVLPVKVKFTDCNGTPLTNLNPAIRLAAGDLTPLSDDGTAPIIVPSSASGADTTGIMRSNGDGSYIYNMSVNVTLNKDYTVLVYPYGTGQPQRLGHVIQATK